MDKEIKCPGKNLERFLLLLGEINFKDLGKEPSVKDARMLARLMNDTKEGEEISKEKIREVYKRTIRIKIEDRRGAEKLSYYGHTRKEISDNLKEHICRCHNCSKRYLNFIVEGAVLYLKGSKEIISDDNCPPEVLLCAQEELNKGLPAIIKQEDERYLGLLK